MQEILKYDDGRIEMVAIVDGRYMATYNRYPYSWVEISQEQFSRYRPYLTQDETIIFPGQIYSGYKTTGLPKIINWILNI